MRVVEWVEDSEINDAEVSVGSLGGWFKDGMRWPDFIKRIKEEYRPYYEAIRVSVIENGYRHTGEYHQYGGEGVPVFEDGTIGSFSWRAWGDLMAAIWSTEEDKDYCYMDFYM
jgi:hypothetical protein